MAPVVTMKQLLEAGVHFGHQTRRWNPKMKRFILGERNGIYVIDLQQTLSGIEKAYSFVRDLVADGGTILFIGTKKQAQEPVEQFAKRCGMPFVNQRWLGGMLTNFDTISKRVGKMLEYERMRDSGEFAAMPKKEALHYTRELEKLERNLGGIRSMTRAPEAVFVLDTKKEQIAVTEANKLRVPVVAVVDTNCDPDVIQFVVPGNDDAIRAASLMCRIISDAVQEGRFIASKKGVVAGPGPGPAAAAPAERTPEEQARHAAEQAEARRQAAAQAREREARIARGREPAEAEPESAAAEAATTPEATEPAAVEREAEGPAAAEPETAEPQAVEEAAPAAAGPEETEPAEAAPAEEPGEAAPSDGEVAEEATPADEAEAPGAEEEPASVAAAAQDTEAQPSAADVSAGSETPPPVEVSADLERADAAAKAEES
jgi:small subunit ribosomal protein S2